MATLERVLTAGSCEPSDGVTRATSVAATPKSGGHGSFSAAAAQEPTLRAGETVFYWNPEFTVGEIRARSFCKIDAIRVLRTGSWPSLDGMLIEGRSKEKGTTGTDATRTEIFFDGRLILETDHGVQRHRDINGKLLHKMSMLPLKKYRLIPSDAPAVRQG